jgi:AcrR family transcriptional regulator
MSSVPTAVGATTPRFQEKSEALLGAAAERFNALGVRGATLAGIGAQVGLATNSVTYYYRKKEDLAQACFLRSIDAIDAMLAVAGQAPTVAQRVQSLFAQQAQLLAQIDTGQQAPLVLFNDIRALPSPQLEQVFSAYTAMFRRLRALLSGPETTALPRPQLNARAHLVLSVAHWLRSWIVRHETDEYPRVAARVADILLQGVATPGARWPERAVDDAHGSLERPAGGPGEAFLRAATVLVNEQGYRGASVTKISARLNVTKGSFYHHHDKKQDLISACFERSFDVMRRAFRLAEDQPGRGLDRASAAARALVRFQCSEQGPLLRSTATSALPDQAERERVRRTMDQLTERMACVLVDGLVDGSVRPLDTHIAAQGLVAMINAAAELHRWVPGVDGDSAMALYVRPAFLGLLCDAGEGGTAG